MKNIIIVLTALMVLGCDKDVKIEAPSHIKPHLHHLYKQIPQCFKDNGLADGKYGCDVTVKTTPATGTYKGVPIFEFDGRQVGAVTYGKCKSSSTIVIAQQGDNWSREILQHEMCHAYDNCKLCTQGHPSEQAVCCPHWPYIRSLEMREECITIKIGDIWASITTLDSPPMTNQVEAVNYIDNYEDWFYTLMSHIDPDFEEPIR